jgi:hypothetical protein
VGGEACLQRGNMDLERERERARRAVGRAAKGWGWTPPSSRSSIKGEEERETTLPPSSSLCITPPPLRDKVCQPVGTVAGKHQSKHPRTGTGSPTNSLGWLHPMQVTSDHEERDEHSTSVNGIDPLFRDLVGPGNLGRDYGCNGHSSGGILIESQRSQTPIQEGPH